MLALARGVKARYLKFFYCSHVWAIHLFLQQRNLLYINRNQQKDIEKKLERICSLQNVCNTVPIGYSDWPPSQGLRSL